MANFPSLSNNSTHDAERWTSRVLRLGVWTSAGLMITGLVIAAIHPSTITIFSGNPTLRELFSLLFSNPLDSITLLFVGLVVLMFTPVLRVLTAIVGFAKEHDWRFVIVSCVVFIMLVGEIIYSLFLKG